MKLLIVRLKRLRFECQRSHSINNEFADIDYEEAMKSLIIQQSIRYRNLETYVHTYSKLPPTQV